MAREEEKGQSHDAVNLSHSAQSYEQSSPEILLFLDKVKAEQYTSQYQTIALRIKNTGVRLYSDKPKDKQLLAPAEKRLPDAPIGHVGNYQHPAQPAKLIGQYCQRCHQEREQRTVKEIIVILWIDNVERHLLPGMPKRVIKDRIVEVELSRQPYSEPGHDHHDQINEADDSEIREFVAQVHVPILDKRGAAYSREKCALNIHR